MHEQILIQLEKVGKEYRHKTALHGIDLKISAGQIISLIGPNGAGKTTLARLVLGLEKPTSGSIERKKSLNVGYMPQKVHIDSTLPLTVLRFLQLAEPDTELCLKALERVNILKLSKESIQTLSGGEMQRALLARALLRQPELLVLDEPVQGVDIIGQEALYQLITELRDELGCAILMVSHDLHLVMSATDEVVCLNQHICCHGNPEQVSDNPAYLELFGAKAALYTHNHNHDHNLHGDVICEHGITSTIEESRAGECDHHD